MTLSARGRARRQGSASRAIARLAPPPLVPVLTARNRARAYPAAQASKARRTISARFRCVNRKIDILTLV